MSGGRLLPAGGLGIDLPAEVEAMGVRRDERAARLAESITLIKALWSGEPTTHHGRFWSVTDLALTPAADAPAARVLARRASAGRVAAGGRACRRLARLGGQP